MSQTKVIVALCVAGACSVAYFGWMVLGCFSGYGFTRRTCDVVDDMLVRLLTPRVEVPPEIRMPIVAVVAVALTVFIVRQVRGRPGGG